MFLQSLNLVSFEISSLGFKIKLQCEVIKQFLKFNRLFSGLLTLQIF